MSWRTIDQPVLPLGFNGSIRVFAIACHPNMDVANMAKATQPHVTETHCVPLAIPATEPEMVGDVFDPRYQWPVFHFLGLWA